MAIISEEELHSFHKIDREVFFRLIMLLAHSPSQSLLVMALWLWLESIGYPNFMFKLVGCSDSLLNALTNEAVTCLRCLESSPSEDQIIDHQTPSTSSGGGGGGLPLTTVLLKNNISLQFFRQKRFTSIAGIKKVLNNVCARIFHDILQVYFTGNANTSASTSTSTGMSRPTSPYYFSRPMIMVPGFPHPLFGTFTSIPPINFQGLNLYDPRIWINKFPYDGVTDDDKTMFLTFSRGFPVTEFEVWHLFTTLYGDCIKVLSMGNGNMGDQVLFATMVLKNVETIDDILNGKHVAKFRLNGKHIWARKYERRDST